MSYSAVATTNKVPIFGVPGTVKVGAEVHTRSWDITSITVTPGSDLWEGRDANGKIVSRIHFNQVGSAGTPGVNRSTTITINYTPVDDTAEHAFAEGVIIPNGTTFLVADSTVPGANGTWECTGNTATGTNTEATTMVLNGVYAASNA